MIACEEMLQGGIIKPVDSRIIFTFHSLRIFGLVNVDVFSKNYGFLLKHCSNYHVPVWSPFELLNFNLLDFKIELTSRNIIKVNGFKPILVIMKMCSELLDKTIVISLLQKIDQ
jgi:hypothetical protein